MKFLRRLLTVAVLLLSSSSYAQLSLATTSTIRIANLKTYCVQRSIPYMQADIVINDADKGLPGILYVGIIDDEKQNPFFLTAGGWTRWAGGSIPVYGIMRDGLQTSTVSLNLTLTSLPELSSRNIYMGYGALSAASEKIVQGGIKAVATVRQKFPERQIPSVDPDMHRLALVQDDMTRHAKYQFVINSASFPVCETN